MIRRGSTPTHTFTLPFDTSLIKAASVVYSQNDIKILTKRMADLTKNGKTLSVKLTQKETFLFNPKEAVSVQVRVLTNSGDALNSLITKVNVSDSLSEEVLI